MMSAWYDSAIFYHIYPLGLCGCEKENDYKEKESKFPVLNRWVSHMADMGFNAVYIGPLLNPDLTDTIQQIIKGWTAGWEQMKILKHG